MKFALIVISLIGSASAWSSLSMKVGKLVVAARVEMRQGSGLQKIRDGSLGDGWLAVVGANCSYRWPYLPQKIV